MKTKDIQKAQEFAKVTWEAIQGWLWLALMWLSIGVNFTHIEDILAKWAKRSDWTTWGMASAIEIISGLAWSNALTNLGVMLASLGRSVTKERKRRARTYFVLSLISGFIAIGFSAYANVLWFNYHYIAGLVAPAATMICAVMEASRRYEIRIQTENNEIRREKEKQRAEAICNICNMKVGKDSLIDGKCPNCQRAAEGKTHALPLELSLTILERDEWQCYYCGENLRDVPAGKRHIDHFIPKSKGGQDIPENLVTSCQPCNLTKNDRLPNEREQQRFSLYLRAKAAGPDKRTQILELASTNGDRRPLKQKEIAEILHTSPGWVSTIIREAEQSQDEEG